MRKEGSGNHWEAEPASRSGRFHQLRTNVIMLEGDLRGLSKFEAITGARRSSAGAEPPSRKQEHWNAGFKRLQKFREGKEKKVPSLTSTPASNVPESGGQQDGGIVVVPDKQPAGERGLPASEDFQPAGERVLPASDSGQPAGEPVLPKSDDGQPAGEPVLPTSEDGPRDAARHRHCLSPATVDDLSALEQHIEDLTQEKVSLQRSLASANELATQLAKDHSSLTEHYNQQGKVVNQLRDELAQLEAEIQAQALVVASLRAERQKAQRESAAAVEQSHTLAAEVVALGERVLEMRSQGLKLERSTEALAAANELQKKQVVALEKDRANLKSMFEAVDEEKKVLTSRLHQSSKSQHVPLGSLLKADACTGTDDLESEPTSSQPPPVSEDQPAATDPSPSSSAVPAQPSPAGVSSPSLGDLSASLPDSHLKSLESIDSLLLELADDKAALIRAITAESASAAELRSANVELQQKLEAQTHRLELALARSMAARDWNWNSPLHHAQVAESSAGAAADGVLGRIKWLIPPRKPAPSRRRHKTL